jgi:hypothetical protein
MYGKDYNYARTRIEGTIVRIRKTNEPVHVQNVSRQNGICSVSLITDADGKMFPTNLDDLNVEPVPLGYVNNGGNAFYLQRIPNRRGPNNQGLNVRNCMSSGPLLFEFPTKSLRQCIIGEYPKFDRAYEESNTKNKNGRYKIIAFHRHWAIKNGVLMYKNKLEVGVVKDGKAILSDKFHYLKEALEEAV